MGSLQRRSEPWKPTHVRKMSDPLPLGTGPARARTPLRLRAAPTAAADRSAPPPLAGHAPRAAGAPRPSPIDMGP
eukprot:9473786-Pyramimonas_sp.AAC.1